MRLHGYRDRTRAGHLDLVGEANDDWTVDLQLVCGIDLGDRLCVRSACSSNLSGLDAEVVRVNWREEVRPI
jgi:hypothetical protein